MLNSYKSFKFNGKVYDDLFNITLSNDFFSFKILGSASIIEEKIPGRDIPYFYKIDRSPLEFEVNFSLKDPMLINDLRPIVRELLAVENYAELIFSDDFVSGSTSPTFYAIFTGEPVFNYMRDKDDKYFGYFTLNVRCNAPYGFYKFSGGTVMDYDDFILNGITYDRTVYEINNTTRVNFNNIGDLKTDPYIIIINKSGSTITNNGSDLIISNYDSSSGGSVQSKISFNKFTYNSTDNVILLPNEIIVIDSELKTIISNQTNSLIYERWNKDYLEINVGNNYLITNISNDDVKVGVTFEAPKFI